LIYGEVGFCFYTASVDGGHPRKRIASDQCEVPKSHGSEGKRNDRQNIRTLALPITQSAW
jgi:hypothetical protein